MEQNKCSPWPSIFSLNKGWHFFTVKISNLSMWMVLVHSSELYFCSNCSHCNSFCLNLYNVHGNKINQNIHWKLIVIQIDSILCSSWMFFIQMKMWAAAIQQLTWIKIHQCLKWTQLNNFFPLKICNNSALLNLIS